ncbi:MAG: hypothetical protein ABIG08_03015 [bacterium]
MNKKISTPAGIIIIVLAALLTGGILAWQCWWMPEGEKGGEISQDETADWKTYRNEEYGFEFKYSSNFSLVEDAPVGTLVRVWLFDPLNLDYPDIFIELIETNLIPTEWINNYLCKPLPSGETLCTAPKPGPISEFIQVQSQGTHFNSVDTIFKHNDVLFDISLAEKLAAPIPQDELDIYNQILSTFKSIEKKAGISWIEEYPKALDVIGKEFPECLTTAFAATLSSTNAILLEKDATGDQVPEAMILTGCTGAYTSHAVLFRFVNGKPALMPFLDQSGNEIPKKVFVAGASMMNYLRVGIDSELQSIYQTHGSFSPTDCAVDWNIDVYQWREYAGAFQLDDSLKGTIREKHSDEVPSYYDPKKGLTEAPVENCTF